MKNVFVIGVGLIGGSFALDIKSVYPDAIVYGIDVNESHLEEAINLGVIDKKASFDQLVRCRFCYSCCSSRQSH